MASTAAPPALPSLDPTFGAMLIGIFVATFLEGVLTLQTYIYFTNFKTDRLSLRLLVGAIWILDTLHLCFVCHMQYEYVITHYADPAYLATATWSWNTAVMMTTIIAALIQWYFCWRTWVLTKSITLMASILVLSFIAFGTGLACTAETFILQHFEKFTKYRWLVGVWLGCSAGCDVLVAVSLCYTLYKSRTGFKQTDSILARLILWTLNTGLLTSVVAVIDLICFATMDNLIHFAFNMTLGKFYANMFIATLNQRLRTRSNMLNNTGSGRIDFSETAFSSKNQLKSSSRIPGFGLGLGNGGKEMNVHITTTKDTIHDTPPTPMMPLDHLNKFRSVRRPTRADMEMGDLDEHKLDFDDEYNEMHEEKSVLPHFTNVGRTDG